jgi:putative hydrolase
MDPESLRDAPLFRELQRVMAAGGGGPVNWELARQVGVATAAEAGGDPEPGGSELHGLEEAVRVAELQVTAGTGLEAPARLAPVRAVRRSAWVTANAASLRGLIEASAVRMSGALEASLAEQLPPEAGQLGGLLAQVGPLLYGTQAGQILGRLATQTFATFDLAVPRDGEDDLTFVLVNIEAFERDWSLDPAEVRTAVALREVAARLAFSGPWVTGHLRSLIDDAGVALTIDVDGLMRRFASMDTADADGIEGALDEAAPIFRTDLDDEQRLRLARVHAFLGIAEAFAAHVSATIGAELLPGWPMIAEALRRRGDAGILEPVFSQLLGIPFEPAVLEEARAFCDAVVARTDEHVLGSMWSSADAMPSMPEIREPTLWLSRTV